MDVCNMESNFFVDHKFMKHVIYLYIIVNVCCPTARIAGVSVNEEIIHLTFLSR